MKKRVIWKMFVLEIITLGIYRLYYLIKTRSEMMQKDPTIKIMSPAFLLIPVVLIIAAVVGIIVAIANSPATSQACSSYSNSHDNRYDSNGAPQNCEDIDSGSTVAIILLYVAIFAVIILVTVWLWSYSQGVDKITNGKLSFALALVVLILVPDGIDLLIIQDHFNKLNAGSVPTNPRASSTA